MLEWHYYSTAKWLNFWLKFVNTEIVQAIVDCFHLFTISISPQGFTSLKCKTVYWLLTKCCWILILSFSNWFCTLFGFYILFNVVIDVIVCEMGLLVGHLCVGPYYFVEYRFKCQQLKLSYHLKGCLVPCYEHLYTLNSSLTLSLWLIGGLLFLLFEGFWQCRLCLWLIKYVA